MARGKRANDGCPALGRPCAGFDVGNDPVHFRLGAPQGVLKAGFPGDA